MQARGLQIFFHEPNSFLRVSWKFQAIPYTRSMKFFNFVKINIFQKFFKFFFFSFKYVLLRKST